MDNPEITLKYLKEVEAAGEEIICNKQEILAIDIRRNHAREGLSAMKKDDSDKVWMTLGPLLVKMERGQVENILKKDGVLMDAEINKIRSNLKEKVNHLIDLEHQPPIPGLMLKPMTRQEMNAMGQIFGRRAD